MQKKSSILIEFSDDFSLEFTSETLMVHRFTLELINIANNLISDCQIQSIADVGTGSGIIALSCARERKDLIIYASDISKNVLQVAERNAKNNKINNIKFLHNVDSVWLSELNNIEAEFIISNPPFIGNKE